MNIKYILLALLIIIILLLIYCLLNRKTEGFKELERLKKSAVKVEVIAGTATAGIPHATTLADLLQVPLIYVRSTAKSHGMGNKIEGILKKNQRVLVIEDLISTGGSAVNAVTAVREAGGIVNHCFYLVTIFIFYMLNGITRREIDSSSKELHLPCRYRIFHSIIDTAKILILFFIDVLFELHP